MTWTTPGARSGRPTGARAIVWRPRRRASRWAPGGVRAPNDWVSATGQQVEREPYNLLFGQRKGPDGQKLGRAPSNAGKAVEVYQGLLTAEPGADDHRKAELRIIAQRRARQSPLYFYLTIS
jgi:hypothetical protein